MQFCRWCEKDLGKGFQTCDKCTAPYCLKCASDWLAFDVHKSNNACKQYLVDMIAYHEVKMQEHEELLAKLNNLPAE